MRSAPAEVPDFSTDGLVPLCLCQTPLPLSPNPNTAYASAWIGVSHVAVLIDLK